jgi:hypothetical protein
MGSEKWAEKEIAKWISEVKKLDFQRSIHFKLLSEIKENSVTNGDFYSS